MRITLTVTAGPCKGQEFAFVGHDTFLVGRSARAHFSLPSKDTSLSRIHFLIETNPPHCVILDMGSQNGTLVNGARIERSFLKDGDQIQAGRSVLRVSVTPLADEEWDQPVPLAEPRIAALPRAGQARPKPDPSRCPLCGAKLAAAAPSGDPARTRVCRVCSAAMRKIPQAIPGYQLVRELGHGGVGTVFLALQEATGQPVALKVITPCERGSRTQIERFLREANILSELDHPRIVRCFEMGETNGVFFFAMEYIRGADAAALLTETGPLPIPRAVRLVRQALEGLAYAHDQHFIHRDIKPSNLLVGDEGGAEQVKVADFGLARVYQGSNLCGLTMTGEIGGTVAYMPPEQITSFRKAQPASDQYSAAATLYTLLTAACVYDLPPKLYGQLQMILHEDPVPIRIRRPDIPNALAAVIHRALQRDPKDRWPDVNALAKGLQPFES